MSSTKFPIDEIRQRFPALQQSQVFLDNAGGSQALGSVVEAIHDYLTKSNVQLGASYTSSKLATDLYNKGYQAGAKYINASEKNIVIGSSTTQLFRNLSFALSFPAGSEIILSKLDHEANIASWISLAERQSLVVKWWHPDLSSIKSSNSGNSINPKLTPDNLSPLLSNRTVFVACTHASNILGTIHDISALAATVRSHSPEALFCVDAVAYAPHRAIDVRALDVDFYSFSWYKVYGPHVAEMYASERGLAHVASLGHYFNPSGSLQEKLALAGSSYELVAAIPSVVEYISSAVAGGADTFWTGVRGHEESLQKQLLAYLASNPRITVLGESSSDPALRVSTVSFIVQGKSSREIVEAVDRAAGYSGAQTITGGGDEGGQRDGDMGQGESRQFGIRWGHFYSKRLCEDVLGLQKDGEGVVRVSMVHYNTNTEVRELIDVLKQVIG